MGLASSFLKKPITEKEIFDGTGHNMVYGGACMQGWRKNLEDAHIVTPALSGNKSMSLFTVFDGHGGYEVAWFCMTYFERELLALEEFKEGQYKQALTRTFIRLDEMLISPHKFADFEHIPDMTEDIDHVDSEDEDPEEDATVMMRGVTRKVMHGNDEAKIKRCERELMARIKVGAPCGSTAIAALLVGKELYVANAGDCRCVVSHKGTAVNLSEDHKPTLDLERRRIESAGGYVEDRRVNGNLAVSRAIGDLQFKCSTTLPPQDQIVTACPDISQTTILPEHEFIIIACDGIWDVQTSQQAVDFVSNCFSQGMDPKGAACALLDACLSPNCTQNQGLGTDNMTALVIQLTGTS